MGFWETVRGTHNPGPGSTPQSLQSVVLECRARDATPSTILKDLFEPVLVLDPLPRPKSLSLSPFPTGAVPFVVLVSGPPSLLTWYIKGLSP